MQIEHLLELPTISLLVVYVIVKEVLVPVTRVALNRSKRSNGNGEHHEEQLAALHVDVARLQERLTDAGVKVDSVLVELRQLRADFSAIHLAMIERIARAEAHIQMLHQLYPGKSGYGGAGS